jgi:hypothetical protein
MKWLAVGANCKAIILETEGVTWAEARAYAVRHFGPLADVIVAETGDDAVADIQLRWIGDDYLGGASPNCKRMQQRKYQPIAGSWDAWEDVR